MLSAAALSVASLLSLITADTPPPSAVPAPTPPLKRVAVFDIRGAGLDEKLLKNLADNLAAEIGKHPGYRAIAKSEVEAMLGLETYKQLAGCDGTSCVSDIAGSLGVEYLATGSISALKSDSGATSYSVTLQLLDGAKASALNRAAFVWEGDPAGIVTAMAPYTTLLLEGDTALAYRGTVKVLLQQQKAKVFLDDVEAKPGDAVAATIGKHTVKVVADGYEPYAQPIIVNHDKLTLHAPKLVELPAPFYATWWFWSAAGGAVVLVGGAAAVVAVVLLNGQGEPPATPDGTIAIEQACPNGWCQ